MDGIDGEIGASSVTCINTCSDYQSSNSITIESQQQLTQKIENIEIQITSQKQLRDSLLGEISAARHEIEELQAKPNMTEDDQETIASLQGQIQIAQNELEALERTLPKLEEQYTKYLSFEGYLTEEGSTIKIREETLLTFNRFKTALKKIADEDTDILFISGDLHDCVIGGRSAADDVTYDSSQAPNLGIVYDTLLDFIDNEYTNHRPLTYIGHIRTASTNNDNNTTGLMTDKIQVDSGKTPDSNEKLSDYGVGYGDTDWGAKQIATLFTRENNELSTAGLFYQGGIINGVAVGSMELAAHIVGWLAGRKVGDDLTYSTIPGLTSINDEVFFQKGDAGTLLNNYGIQVIRPKDRLQKTFYVNNSIMPTGWHTNHVRSVIYLLKKYEFEAGLGINNITTNIEAFRTSLENVSKEVMKEVDLIRSVTLGDIEIISNYHVYIPVDIILAGVVTKISVGVSMAIDEEGTAGSTLTTTGYNFYYQEA